MGGAGAGTRPAVRNEGVGTHMHVEARRPSQRMRAVRFHGDSGRDASVVGRHVAPWPGVVRSIMTAAAAVVVVAALVATAVAR